MFIISTIFISSFVCADIQIEDVLPENTIAIVSIKNSEHLADKLEQMGVCETVSQFCDLLKDTDNELDFSVLTEKYEGLIQAFGMDKDDLPDIPSGGIQAGIYPVVDYESGSVTVGILAIADLRDSKWSGIIDTSMTDIAAEMELEIEDVDVSGHSVWMISTTNDSTVGESDLSESDLEHLYVVIKDDHLIAGSDPDEVAAAINVLDGDEEKNTLASNDLYTELRGRTSVDCDIHASVLLTNLADTIMQMDDSGMAMMILPMVKSFFGDVDGFAEAVSFSNSSSTAIDAKYTVYMGEGRNGLLGLISENTADSSIPSYVTEDTLSYSQVQIDMDKVVPFLMKTISANPMLSMQLGPQSEEIEKTLLMAFSPLGTEVHFITSGYLPIASDSLGYLLAIECTDEEAFSEFLTTVMPTMGLDPTDFLGYQIYTADFGGGMMVPVDLSFSYTVGGGYVFIGTTRPVEQALRAIANPSEYKGNQGQNTALQLISKANTAGWGYADPAKSIEIQSQIMDGLSEDMFADMEAFDPDMAAEMREEFEENQERQKEVMNILATLIGPTSWSLTTDENGFNAHGIMLHPE